MQTTIPSQTTWCTMLLHFQELDHVSVLQLDCRSLRAAFGAVFYDEKLGQLQQQISH